MYVFGSYCDIHPQGDRIIVVTVTRATRLIRDTYLGLIHLLCSDKSFAIQTYLGFKSFTMADKVQVQA